MIRLLAYRWADLPRLAGVALLYALLAKIALTFFSSNGIVSIIWLPSGLALAALLVGGQKFWPAIFAGALISNSMAGSAGWTAALIAAGNTLEALVALNLLGRTRFFDRDLTHPRDYLRIIAAGAVSASVAALNGVAALLLSGFLTAQTAWPNLLDWWQGDMLGIILLTPLLLVWRKIPHGWLSQGRLIESIACFGLAFLFGQAIFLNWFDDLVGNVIGFWVFLFVVWAAVRFGRHGALLIIGLTVVQGLLGEVHKVGFFRELPNQSSMLNFWFYTLVLSLIGITLALVIHRLEKTSHLAVASKARLDEAQRIAQVGSWELDLVGGNLLWSDEIFRIFEIDQSRFGANYEAFLNAIHPDDRELVNKAYTDSVASRTPYEISHRLLMPDGGIKWVNERCETYYDNQGKPIRSAGTVQDITVRKQLELHLRAVQDDLDSTLNAVPDLLFELGLDGRYYAVRSPRADLLAAPPSVILGRRVSEILPPEAAAICLAALAEANKQGHSTGRQFELTLDQENKWFELSVARKGVTYPDGPHFIVLSRDITGRKRAEAALLEKESQYREAIETTMDGFWMLDAHGRVLEVNDAYARLSGYSRKELLKMRISDLEVQERPEETAAHLQKIIREGSAHFESKHKKKDGGIWPAQIAISYSTMAGGRFFGFISDLTTRKKAEEALQLASMVYENSSEAMLVTDADNLIIAVNPAFEKMTGYTADDVLGKNPRIFKSDRHDQAFYQTMWHALRNEGHWHGELWDKCKNGAIHAKLLSINTIKNNDGMVFRHVALFSDVTERKKFEELVWKQANFDALTKLPNRHMFHDRIEQEARKSNRAGLPLALMLIDLDHFKEVNDTLGHDKGDKLLVEAARRISHCVRESDTVARLGGDEFIVILPELDDMTSVERVAQSIIGKLAEPFMLEPESAYISASVGISFYPNDAIELDVLFKNADQAMYVSKNTGRNRFSYFTAVLQEQAQKRLLITNDLRGALASAQFRVYYQPIVELASGKIYKAEALLRWQHPVRGVVGPLDFISLAEETGLIVPIGDWVFRQAVQQVRQWRSTYHASFQISVNKSPAQFHQDDTVHISWPLYLQQQGMPGQSIAIEITEGLMLNTESRVNDRLLKYRDAGIQIAIDDFGTGYSSLSYLKKFDIDYLKIDQSFVSDLETDADNQALCEAIIVMAHKLGLKVIAEGVETAGQRDLLLAAGCDYAQGYLFSRPVPPEAFEALLEAQ